MRFSIFLSSYLQSLFVWFVVCGNRITAKLQDKIFEEPVHLKHIWGNCYISMSRKLGLLFWYRVENNVRKGDCALLAILFSFLYNVLKRRLLLWLWMSFVSRKGLTWQLTCLLLENMASIFSFLSNFTSVQITVLFL